MGKDSFCDLGGQAEQAEKTIHRLPKHHTGKPQYITYAETEHILLCATVVCLLRKEGRD